MLPAFGSLTCAQFDLRLYVLVTSVAPLRAEVYHDGLVRLCTEKYEPPTSDNISHTKMHLANWSINKLSVRTNNQYLPAASFVEMLTLTD